MRNLCISKAQEPFIIQAIRRAILRHKARRTKADYDESTFNEEAITTRGFSVIY